MEDSPIAKISETVPSEAPVFNAERWYDAGDKGCAAGPMDEIATIMRQMEPGQKIEIFATDPTVSVDLAAWCRMTGHSLVEQQGFHYLVQHK
jgi:tRNA 2-thiouridine synthesizing protein A